MSHHRLPTATRHKVSQPWSATGVFPVPLFATGAMPPDRLRLPLLPISAIYVADRPQVLFPASHHRCHAPYPTRLHFCQSEHVCCPPPSCVFPLLAASAMPISECQHSKPGLLPDRCLLVPHVTAICIPSDCLFPTLPVPDLLLF